RHRTEPPGRRAGGREHQAGARLGVRARHGAGDGRRRDPRAAPLRHTHRGLQLHAQGVRRNGPGWPRQRARRHRRRAAPRRGRVPGRLVSILRIPGRVRPVRVPARAALPSSRPLRPGDQAGMTYLRLGLVAIAGLAWFIFLPDYRTLGINLMLLAGWATAWDLLGGWSGQTSLGHAAFVGLGAYTIAVTSTRWDLAPWWGALLAMALAAALALLWGKLTFRLRGSYFVLASIAVAEILRLVAINERQLTGGAIGRFIFDLKEPFGLDLFDRGVEFWVALGYLGLVLVVAAFVTRGRLGYQMRAVREDEPSAEAAGINPEAVKLWAFA